MTPPRSQQEWIEEFERYKTYPEYAQYVLNIHTEYNYKFLIYSAEFVSVVMLQVNELCLCVHLKHHKHL